VARAGRSTGEATTVLDSVSQRHRLVTPRRVSIAGVLLVLAGTAAALIIAGVVGDDERANGGGGGGEDTAGAPVALAEATDFDPIGGDGELSEETPKAVDDDPTGTAWVSEHYDTEDFGGLKDGVGIYVETEEPVEPAAMQVTTAESGWAGEVYAAADDPPTTLDGWGEAIGQIPNADTETRIPLQVSAPSRYFLLWFTSLPSSTDDTARFRAEVGDITLLE
jgi:hypothetical protein